MFLTKYKAIYQIAKLKKKKGRDKAEGVRCSLLYYSAGSANLYDPPIPPEFL
jgi:hypothetical protein